MTPALAAFRLACMLSQFDLTPQEAWDAELMYPLANNLWMPRPTFQQFLF